MMLQALSFLTIIGRGPAPHRRATAYFPVVGALVGALVGLAWWGAAQWWPPLVAAVLVVAADALITGMLHLDGLADCGDGLIAPLSRERRLAVMRDPSVGAFGVATLIIVVMLRVAAVASLPISARIIATFAAIWCVSRTGMAVVTLTVRYARAEGGIVSAFTGSRRFALVPLIVGAVIGCSLGAIGAAGPGLVAVAVTAVAMAAVVAGSARRLGGFTGDVLGAAGVIGETLALVGLVAA